MTRSLLLLTACSGLMLTACDGDIRISASSNSDRGDYQTLSRLECPEKEDQLRRTAVAPDGQSCAYAADGAEVQLQLVTLDGQSPDARLASLETELRALMPEREPVTVGAVDEADGLVLGVQSRSDDEAHIRLPGLAIDADNDQAQVRIGGDAMVINADDEEGRVNVVGAGGSTLVNADENGAEVRVDRDEEGDVRRSFKLATDATGQGGWRMVGYEARGPVSGPLVVATLRQREHHDGDISDAADDLVRKVARR